MDNSLTIISATVAVFGLGWGAISTWRQTKSSSTQDLVTLYKEQILTLKEQIDINRKYGEDELAVIRSRGHELANQMTTMSLKIGTLEATLKEKDKQIEDYKVIFQNRNPEMEKMLDTLLSFSRNIETYMKSGNSALLDIKTDISNLKLVNKNRKRDA